MNKNSDINSKFQCLDEAIIYKYLGNSLSRDEKRLVELHLSDCELCNDAVEGFASVEDKSAISPIVENLKTELKLKNGVATNQNNSKRYLYAAAALIVVLFGIGMLFDAVINKKDAQQIFADQFKPYPVKPSENKKEAAKDIESGTKLEESKLRNKQQNDITLEQPGNVSTMSGKEGPKFGLVNNSYWQVNTGYTNDISKGEKDKDTISDKSINSRAENSIKQDKNLEDELLVVTSSTKSVPANEEKKLVYDEVKVSDSKNKSIGSKKYLKKSKSASVSMAKTENYKENNASGSATVNNAPVSIVGGVNANVIDNIDEKVAMDKYSSNDYQGAAEDFEKVLTKSPNNKDALFYSGISNLSLNNVEKAISCFKKGLVDAKSKFYEPSKWYLALSYIKISKNQSG